MAQYTFYREGTPTPDDAGSRERVAGNAFVGAELSSVGPEESAVAERSARRKRPRMSAWDPERGPVICGLRRWVFWVVVAAGLFLVVAVGVGVGVGVGLGKKLSDETTSAAAR